MLKTARKRATTRTTEMMEPTCPLSAVVAKSPRKKAKATTPASAQLKPKAEVPGVVAQLVELQKQNVALTRDRIRQENGLRSTVACTLGYHSGMPEHDRKKRQAGAQTLIEQVAKSQTDHVFRGYITAAMVGIKALRDEGAATKAVMEQMAKQLPVANWVEAEEQRGFGFGVLAQVIGETGDLTFRGYDTDGKPVGYPNPCKVWRRLGCAPWTFNGKTLMGATWRSGKEGKLPTVEWESYSYSPRRRSVAYLIGENMVRQNRGPYRQRYDEAKARFKEVHPDASAGHCHNHGMLLATKLLLKNLWIEWHRCVAELTVQ